MRLFLLPEQLWSVFAARLVSYSLETIRWLSVQIRTCLRRCNAGDVHCVYLESDAGLGKSTLVSILSHNPGISTKHTESIIDSTGEQVEVKGRDAHLVKIQVSRGFWSGIHVFLVIKVQHYTSEEIRD